MNSEPKMTQWALWQFKIGRVNGIGKRTDYNYMRLKIESIKKVKPKDIR